MTYDKKALQELKGSVEAGGESLFGDHVPLDGFSQKFINLSQSAYHGSLDAAISLLEAVLPGWYVMIENDPGSATIMTSFNETEGASWADAETPSRALLLAILDALISEGR